MSEPDLSDKSHPAVVAVLLGNLQTQAIDHEHRLRKVENSIAKSAWLSGLLTPVVTGIVVGVLLQVNGA
jgi:hypothetical protein